MTNTIEMPQKVVDGFFESDRIQPGTYTIAVKKMSVDMNRVTAVYVIQEEGDFKDRLIFDSFNLEYETGQKQFRGFLDAIGVPPHRGVFDLDNCLGKVMAVTVKHKKDNDKVFVNVTNHLPL